MSDIPEAAIEKVAQFLARRDGSADAWTVDRRDAGVILHLAAPHLLKEAYSAIEHLHNEVGTLTDALHRILSLERAPVSQASAIAREALRALEAPSE